MARNKLYYVEETRKYFIFTDGDPLNPPVKLQGEIDDSAYRNRDATIIDHRVALDAALSMCDWFEEDTPYCLGIKVPTLVAAMEITAKSLKEEALEKRGICFGDYVQVKRLNDSGIEQVLLGYVANGTAQPVRAYDVWSPELGLTIWVAHEAVTFLGEGFKAGRRVHTRVDRTFWGTVIGCDPLFVRVRWDADLPAPLKISALPYCALELGPEIKV